MRTQVNSDVKNAYDADKDFALSFIEAYIVELVTEIFGLDDHLSQPTKNIPPEFTTKEEKKQWTVAVDTFGKMVDEFVWPKHKPKNPVVDKSVVVDGQFMNLKVACQWKRSSNKSTTARKEQKARSINKDATGDELMMIGDLRKLRPFKFEAGRYHSAFPDINKSAVDNLPRSDYHTWITTRIVTSANDLGD
ncbi:unnamed protein product [Mytilus edulis]|uniref:Uncharacterized protein n=1 Tax=Mytilus edulis TaxID=6550 RepID=A0A8S3TAR2_MYTED|nr:unnamed protein product [Mytilus edulis]